jgi:multidrug efflux pump subunit AcrA (membrane-fusion protein)
MSNSEKNHHKKPFFKRRSVQIIAGILLAIFIIGGIVVANQPKVDPNTQYFVAYKSDIQKYIKDSSVLEPLDIRKISASSGSKITEILVTNGSAVTAGQVIAKVDFNGKVSDITSPIAGTLVKSTYEVGENIGQVEAFQVADNSNFKLVTKVSSSEINSIKVDQVVKIKIKAIDSETEYIGKVTVIDAFAELNSQDELSSTYNVRIKLDEKPLKAVAGMKANVTIYGAKQEKALVVNNDLIIQKSDGSKYIKLVEWIDKDKNISTIREIKITTGIESDTKTEILTGVNDGDKIAKPTDEAKLRPFSLIPPR